MERINPLNAEVASEKTSETANHNSIDDVSICPADGCGKPMRIMRANGHNCFVCLTHRIALPCPD